MKITSLKFRPVAVERQYGTVIAKEGGKARATVAKSFFYFLSLTTDTGLTAWGEISDIDPDELPKDPAEYAQLLLDFVRDRNPFEVQRMHADARQHFDMSGSLGKAAACALDMAMYDLQGQSAGCPVYDLLGGAVRKSVDISWVAYIREDLDALREEIRQRVAEGFRAFKLKVGVDIELDEKRVALVRELAGAEASIKVDANEGWSVKDAPENIRRLDKYRLDGVETPVKRDNPADIAAVRKQVKVPILEHVNDLAYALALLKADAVDVFNISCPGAGGIFPARQIVAMAQAAKLGVLIGSTVELGVGTLAQLHLAATVPNLTLPSDLIGPGMYKRDVLKTPLRYREGKLDVPTGVGLGGQVSADNLKALRF
jgi:muconate cycloisomerase